MEWSLRHCSRPSPSLALALLLLHVLRGGGGGARRARGRGAGPDERRGEEEPRLHLNGAGRLLRRRACQLQQAGGPARQGL